MIEQSHGPSACAHCGDSRPDPEGVHQAEKCRFLCALRCGGACPCRLPALFIASRTFDVGRLVERRTPKVTSRRDGTTQTSTHRRVIEDGDVQAALESIALFLHECGVGRAVVERATFFHGEGTSGAGARAAGLLRAQWIGGEIAGALRGAGMPVETCSSATWRACAKRLAKGASWREAVRATIGGMPAAIGEHGLDAAGAALWGARPPEAATAPRARVKGAKRDRSRERDAAKAARAKALAAAGCRCPPPVRLHKDPACPVGAAANAKRAEKMRGNGNARKSAQAEGAAA